MAKLTGQTIADSYDQLLIVDHADGISSSLQAIESADTGGSTSALQISTVGICVSDPTTSSATEGALLRLQSNDSAAVTGSGHRLGIIEFSGEEDASDTMVAGAQIYAIADAAFTATGTYDHATRLEFAVQNGTSGSDGLASPAMTIDSSGNVGIGTDSPSQLLEVASQNTSCHITLTAETSGDYNSAINFADNSAIKGIVGWDDGQSAMKLVTGTANDGITGISILASGNVGLGTATPAEVLEVGDGSGNNYLLISGDGNSGVKIGDGTSSRWRIDNIVASDSLRFYADVGSTTEVMRMLSSGNVGIGTDSPGATLEVTGTIVATMASVANLANNGSIPITSACVNVDADGDARTGIRFAGAGIAGQILFVNNTGGETLAIHDTDSTGLLRGATSSYDTLEPGSMYMFVSDGTYWNFIGGGASAFAGEGLTAS